MDDSASIDQGPQRVPQLRKPLFGVLSRGNSDISSHFWHPVLIVINSVSVLKALQTLNNKHSFVQEIQELLNDCQNEDTIMLGSWGARGNYKTDGMASIGCDRALHRYTGGRRQYVAFGRRIRETWDLLWSNKNIVPKRWNIAGSFGSAKIILKRPSYVALTKSSWTDRHPAEYQCAYRIDYMGSYLKSYYKWLFIV